MLTIVTSCLNTLYTKNVKQRRHDHSICIQHTTEQVSLVSDRPTYKANNSQDGKKEGTDRLLKQTVATVGKRADQLMKQTTLATARKGRVDKKTRKLQEKKESKCKVIPQFGAPGRYQAPPA